MRWGFQGGDAGGLPQSTGLSDGAVPQTPHPIQGLATQVESLDRSVSMAYYKCRVPGPTPCVTPKHIASAGRFPQSSLQPLLPAPKGH